LPLYNQLKLEKVGVNKKAIHLKYNLCTICDNSFCSHRREPIEAKRQITIVALKSKNNGI
jgi:copper oxidase (laccase) domain-containing protein